MNIEKIEPAYTLTITISEEELDFLIELLESEVITDMGPGAVDIGERIWIEFKKIKKLE